MKRTCAIRGSSAGRNTARFDGSGSELLPRYTKKRSSARRATSFFIRWRVGLSRFRPASARQPQLANLSLLQPANLIQPQQLLPVSATRSHPVDSGFARRPPRYSACAAPRNPMTLSSTITATSTMESTVTYLFPDLCQKARMPAKSAVYKTASGIPPR